MFQDQERLKDLHSLPPVKQAEVADFIQFLKAKEQSHSPSQIREQKKLEKAASLLLGTPDDIDSEEIALWDAVLNAPDKPFQCEEPELPNDS